MTSSGSSEKIIYEVRKMKLKYVSIDQIPDPKPRGAKPGVIMKILDDFISSGEDAALVDWKEHYKSIQNAARSIGARISRIKAAVSVCCRGEALYLLRKGGERDA